MILNPILVFFDLIINFLIKLDLAWASDNENLVIDKVNLTQFLISDILPQITFQVKWLLNVFLVDFGRGASSHLWQEAWAPLILGLNWDRERVALSIEGVDDVFFIVEEAFNRKVFPGASQFDLCDTIYSVHLDFVQKMEVRQEFGVEKIHK